MQPRSLKAIESGVSMKTVQACWSLQRDRLSLAQQEAAMSREVASCERRAAA